jgi:hypothetical protein
VFDDLLMLCFLIENKGYLALIQENERISKLVEAAT